MPLLFFVSDGNLRLLANVYKKELDNTDNGNKTN